jgi:hypothetical protein
MSAGNPVTGIDTRILTYYHAPRLSERGARVGGDDHRTGHLFSYLSPEQRMPTDHRLRAIRAMTDDAVRRLSPRFETLYATTGRPSIPPEHLLRALLAPGARGHEARLAYIGEVLMENPHGLVVDACVVPATGTGELDAATSLVAGLSRRRVTIAGDKEYDTRGFVETLRAPDATPHVILKTKSRTIDRRTTRHRGYAISQRARKRIEEVFGWMKPVGGLRKLRHRGGGRRVALFRGLLTDDPATEALIPLIHTSCGEGLIASPVWRHL